MSEFYFDTHMHFDLYKNRDRVIEYLEKIKSYTIVVTNLPELFEKYIKCYGTFKYVKFALGFHPELVYQYSNQINIFTKCVKATRYIGEIGLDFNTTDSENRKKQMEIFEIIVAECNYFDDKILTVHSRKAAKEVLSVLESNKSKVILHWYSGGIKELKEAIERGYYFSINQQMIKSNNGKKIINLIPLDRILFESDAPFTIGLEEQYNISFMDEIYQFLSETRDLSVDELSRNYEK